MGSGRVILVDRLMGSNETLDQRTSDDRSAVVPSVDVTGDTRSLKISRTFQQRRSASLPQRPRHRDLTDGEGITV